MAYVKVSLSLEGSVVELLRSNAAREGKPLSRYLADLIRQDEPGRRDRLAVEGYRELAQDSRAFAQDAEGLAAEVWPSWGDE